MTYTVEILRSAQRQLAKIDRRDQPRIISAIYPFLVALASLFATASEAADGDNSPPKPATFTLWQLPEQVHRQMMSYVIRTAGGKIVVIDGGTTGDAPYLRGFLAALGNTVEAWFITHPHFDHVEALTEILPHPQGLKIGAIYASMPDNEWVAKFVTDEYGEASTIDKFLAALKAAGQLTTDLKLGQVLVIDDVRIQVLGVRNPEITRDELNNSSVVLRVSDLTKSVLFLGDLSIEGGEKLLHGPYRDKLRADYVQMAHHGQRGVGEDVYRAVNPSYCLWPTPRWQWDNDAGQGKETGPWRTLEVRTWMAKLNVKRHYLSADGLHRID